MLWVQTTSILALIYLVDCHVAIRPREFLVDAKKQSKTDENAPNEEDRCTPLVSCPAHLRKTSNSYCRTRTQRQGVLCTTGQNHTDQQDLRGRQHTFHMDSSVLSQLQMKSRSEMTRLRTREAALLASKEPPVLLPGPATYGHFRNSRSFDMHDLSEMMHVANSALQLAIATRAFKDRHGLSNEDLELGMIDGDLRPTQMGQACAPVPFCPLIPDKYRRIDGVCNNILQPSWGGPFTAYSRLLPASYQDGVWAPRTSVVGEEPLPSPRLISASVISDLSSPSPDYTLAVMQFGQFISHDFTQSMDMSFTNGSAISCCAADGASTLPPQSTHYACLPIDIPADDPFFGKFRQRCMNFVRSILAPNNDCSLGYSEQMNKLTHFIDASSVYGSTPEQTSQLRSFRDGKLKVFDDFGRDLLPMSKDPNACLTMEQGSACFESGDTRTNQMITLTVMHTLFLREHNRLARELGQLNPHWDDEKLFLEARQILMAEMQVIIYQEFLPTVLGREAMEEFGVELEPEGKYSLDYNPMVDPSITNEFAAAAFRFGHSAVEGQLKIFGPSKMEEVIAIPELMFYPSRMRHQEFLDEVLSTLTTEPMQDVDGHISEMLTKYTFRGGNPFGVDLAAINIQRGRDHGLRPYNDYRQLIGLPRINDFDEFGPEIGSKLRAVYQSVDDVDLWVGGLLEDKPAGSMLSLTFRDIIADQFARLKKGDRYFFQNDPSINPGHFTPEQLAELRKASLSRIICDNSDKMLLSRQARNAFRKPGVSGNEFFDCRGPEIPRLDLTLWHS
ncbi:chorion peroxidase isoform X1 [Dendroctonus ponderosae]|nr:chorion peroxidase isoform X1 [Dendroctonus ponderosae]XP_048526212.1 chorion peroxidase isoform X1 [Dendroctonus ponderosae]